MKQKYILVFIIILVLTFTGCFQQQEHIPESVDQPNKMVGVFEITDEIYPEVLKYFGTVQALGFKRYAFNQTGKITGVYIQNGQKINKGDQLIQLDTKDHDLAFEEAVNNLTKAATSYEFLEKQYGKIKDQKEEGEAWQKEYERIKLDFELAEINLKNSLVDYEDQLNLLEGTSLYADISGVVTEIYFRSGEIVEKGETVVVLREKQLVVEIGVPQGEVAKIADSVAEIEINGREILGKVIDIAQIPEPNSRTYKVRIALAEDQDLMLGEVATVTFYFTRDQGTAIPLHSLISKSEDCVYLVQDQQIVSKNVQILGVTDDYVLVDGLEKGDLLVVEGLNYVCEGDRVHFY